MNPDLDIQGRRQPWPIPGDTALDRARKIAHMYRAQLHALNPDACNQADATAQQFGETWVVPQTVTVEDTDAITTSEAAQLVHVSEDVIRQWACNRHPEHPDQPLLPRHGWRGRERTYLAQHVRDAALTMLQTKRRKAQLTRSS
ncbi:hypothetical protein ACH4T9_12530 [Micromonospora sp. NPDC020750]|uniref:hypothetical protein n=1 Tax=unclassified Micromonospora TaxID=2617518 RepID=UPI0037A0BD64